MIIVLTCLIATSPCIVLKYSRFEADTISVCLIEITRLLFFSNELHCDNGRTSTTAHHCISAQPDEYTIRQWHERAGNIHLQRVRSPILRA